MKKIIIKFVASEDIGLGHLYRAVSLAKMLKQVGCKVICAINNFDFAKRELLRRGIRWISNNFSSEEDFVDALILSERPDVIVFDERHEYRESNLLKWKKTARLVSIDFIGKDYHLFDQILIPNAHFVDRYPGTLNVLWGLEYVIINEDVRDRKPKVSVPNTVERIAVTTGGSDPEGVLFWLIDAMRYICKDTSVSFLIGKAFKHRDRLSMVKLPKNFSLRPYSLDAIVDSDVVISAFGITVYELIYLRIPALIVSHTKENAISANVLKERCGCIETLGFFREVSIGIAAERIRGFIKNSSKLSELFHREASLKMYDVDKIVKGVLGGGVE